MHKSKLNVRLKLLKYSIEFIILVCLFIISSKAEFNNNANDDDNILG